MHDWSWRGDICTLVTGHRKPNKSDQTHSSVRPAYQQVLSAQKASEEGFIVTYWQFKEKLSSLLSHYCWQKVIDLTLNALHGRKTRVKPICQRYGNLFPQYTWRSNTSCLKCLTPTFFVPKQTVIAKTVEKGRTLHLIELSKDRACFSTKPFFFLVKLSKGTSDSHKCIMEIWSHWCSTCSKKGLLHILYISFPASKKTQKLVIFVNRGDENGCWQF